MSRAVFAIAAAVVAFVAGCTNPVQVAAHSADVLSKSAVSMDKQISQLCEAVEVQAIQEAASKVEAADRVSAIRSKCDVAWRAFGTFTLHLDEFTAAVASANSDPSPDNIADVLDRLNALVVDERALVEAASNLTGELGGDAN